MNSEVIERVKVIFADQTFSVSKSINKTREINIIDFSKNCNKDYLTYFINLIINNVTKDLKLDGNEPNDRVNHFIDERTPSVFINNVAYKPSTIVFTNKTEYNKYKEDFLEIKFIDAIMELCAAGHIEFEDGSRITLMTASELKELFSL